MDKGHKIFLTGVAFLVLSAANSVAAETRDRKGDGGITETRPMGGSYSADSSHRSDDAGRIKERDNTGVNKRDRQARSVTSDDQSNKSRSVHLTSKIRQALVEREDLSTYAHNVKIITDDSGSVTLRGPVRTEAERKAVAELARNIAGRDVRNELEIAPENRKG